MRWGGYGFPCTGRGEIFKSRSEVVDDRLCKGSVSQFKFISDRVNIEEVATKATACIPGVDENQLVCSIGEVGGAEH